jgi:glutamyl-tRNA reductase
VAGPHVAEVVALSTCNRVEFYAAVPAFHAGLHQIVGSLAEIAGMNTGDLADSLYVHHGEAAVAHTFSVAAGLDSMVVGEQQILGQLRDAYALASEAETAGALLHELLQQALRVGKRAHAETGIDQAPRSMVSAALAQAAEATADGSLAGKRAVVIGAGAMGSLAVSGLTRAGVGRLTVVNRSADRADRLAGAYAVEAAPIEQLPSLVAEADVVISATTSMGYVITPEVLGDARPILVDLAVPRDVHPAVKESGVPVVDVEHLAGTAAEHGHADQVVAEAQSIVDAEVAGFLAWQRGSQVAPTVAALRARGEELVTTELARLARRADLTDDQRTEVSHAMRRIVQRLLHEPTVRVRQLAAGPGGEAYPQLLRELFDLQVPGHSRVDQVAAIATPEGAA